MIHIYLSHFLQVPILTVLILMFFVRSRTMYWTSFARSSNASIFKSGTDGSELSIFVANLACSSGLMIDYDSSRIYWTDCKAKKIQSSDLGGSGIVTVAELPSGPYGLALAHQRLFWSLPDVYALQSGNKDGGLYSILSSGSSRFQIGLFQETKGVGTFFGMPGTTLSRMTAKSVV